MAENENETSLKQIIQGMTGGEVSIYQGTVTSASPLRIQIANDEKLVITDANTYVPWHLTDYTTTADIVGGRIEGSTGTAGAHTHAYAGTTERAGDPEHTHSYSGNTDSGGGHSHEISSVNIYGATMTVYNALKAGDKVHILSLNHGKQYYVLDRV